MRVTILLDSTVDEFTDGGLFDKVEGKRNIAIVGFTTDGDVFGGFSSVAVVHQGRDFYYSGAFIFSFESHGRCMTPQKFVVKEGKSQPFVHFCKNNGHGFVWVGDYFGGFYMGNERSASYCSNLSHGFGGLEDTTLTGKNGIVDNGPYHCTRIVAIQLQ